MDPYLPPAGAPPGADPRSRVNLPAILIIAAQALGLLIELLSLALKDQMNAFLKSYMESLGKPLPPGATDSNPIFAILGVAGGIFVVYAMLEMRKLRRFPIAVAGTILAMLPIGSLCCCFGLPLGIWALVILFDPDVRASFG
jgi:hypothetical protein